MRLAFGFTLFAIIASTVFSVSAFEARDEPQGDDRAKAVAATSQFTVDLYKAIRARDGNIFCSPLNIAAALEMAAIGARGETADQIRGTLKLAPLGQRAPEALGGLLKSLHFAANPADFGDDRGAPGLSTANALWLDERLKPLAGFTETLDRAFQAEPHMVDFAHAPDAARETINRWVEDQTRDRIQDLLGPDHVRPDTSFVLTSAIYFKGDWRHPFERSATRDDQFHPSKGESVPVKMMNQTETLLHFENDSLQAVALPYAFSTLSMLVILPKSPDGLSDLETSLSAETLAAATLGQRPKRVKLSLPRFTSTVEFELKDVLSALGMPLAFQAGKADFSGITGSSDFFVSEVVHKAFVNVDEEGSEAAAATGLIAGRMAAMPVDEIVFRADRPFLHLIRDNQTGAILFIGRVSRP